MRSKTDNTFKIFCRAPCIFEYWNRAQPRRMNAENLAYLCRFVFPYNIDRLLTKSQSWSLLAMVYEWSCLPFWIPRAFQVRLGWPHGVSRYLPACVRPVLWYIFCGVPQIHSVRDIIFKIVRLLSSRTQVGKPFGPVLLDSGRMDDITVKLSQTYSPS